MSDAPRDEDVVELGGSGPARWLPGGRLRLPGGWRPPPGRHLSRGAGVLAGAALAVGLAAGYTAGSHQARSGTARPEPTVTVTARPSAALPPGVNAPDTVFSFAGETLAQNIGACSVQTGRHLALGVQVTNVSTVPVTLQTVRAVLPLGGLTLVSWTWTPCGALPQTLDQADDILQPGASTWLTMTFDVHVSCPAPYPVQFTVGFLAHGRHATNSLPGFPDLGQIPYNACPVNTAEGSGN